MAHVQQLATMFGAVAIAVCVSCTVPPVTTSKPVWAPGVVEPSIGKTVRGLVDVRGLIHAHSVYSHDACDNAPVDDAGVRDPVCFDDFRRGVCQSKHDFVFLTDHASSFADTEMNEALLARPDRGDVVVSRDGAPVFNRAACDNGSTPLIMAGFESGTMTVGLEHHIAPPGQRNYDAIDDVTLAALRDAGGVVLMAHPEDFSVDALKGMNLDGFEMYNLHANTLQGAGAALDLLVRLDPKNGKNPDGLLDPNLLVYDIFSEDPRYLERWGRVLASGKHVTTTMGTDCHRNTFRNILRDGERVDSYRRMMISFSNHLLLDAHALDDGLDDRDLKDALKRGRVYGAFEMLGYPAGFDAHLENAAGDVVGELGDTVAQSSTLVVTAPHVVDLDPHAEAPLLITRILKAVDTTDGFVEVARGTTSVRAVLAEPGAYRAEVRMVPRHLRAALRDDVGLLENADGTPRDVPWIYAGAVYVK
jgi:hypothetical protein